MQDIVHQNVNDVLDTYKITKTTCALIPTRSMLHQTKVVEESSVYYVNQSPLEIIKLNCLLNGSDYNGRREAIKYHLNFKRKVPIAINQYQYAFPTHSIKDFDCMWLFSNQIAKIKTKGNKSKIIFKNNKTLKLTISEYILKEQNLRCFAVINLFKQIKNNQL